jgi:GNAT superfamily N-acetyltransferase
MILIHPSPTFSLRPLFNLPYLGFVIDAITAGNSPGAMWVDDPTAPRSAFVWDTTHSLYLGGDANNPTFNDALRRFIAESLLPQGREKQLGVFKIYTASSAWAALAPDLFQVESLPTRERVLFRLESPTIVEQPPTGFQVHQIDRALLEDSTHPNADRVLEEIESCWTSLDQFWERGFGFAALSDTGEIAAWCTAEYVSDKTCGVGIETVEDYQKLGLGTLVARAFASHCTANGWTAHWDSWQSNLPSIKVAQKAGFQKVSDYSVQIYVF